MLPIFTSETCLSKIFIVIGKIISHNICQGGEGFPYLTPSVYNYIVCGNIKEAIMSVKMEEVATPISVSYTHLTLPTIYSV